MRPVEFVTKMVIGAATFLGLSLPSPRMVVAHCDTMDGPVVTAAKAALGKGDVTLVMKWVGPEDEEEVRAAFAQAQIVRAKGPEAKELADRYFFETLVRLHRAGEGAPYTGLKPAGTEIEPAVAAADKALVEGSADTLVKRVSEVVATGIHRRYAHVQETKKHADESVEKGREYVAAYVDYVHYVLGIHVAATGTGAHHGKAESGGVEHSHDHQEK